MINLQEEFKKETKETAYDLCYLKYNEYYVEWLEAKIEQLRLNDVSVSLPSQEEIDERIDKYAFRVPYDGSNNFYDEVALKHYKAGIDWLLSRIRGNGA